MNEEILTVAQCRQADNLTIEQGISETELMAHAGLAVAQVVQSEYPNKPVFILAGPGNNGGDAIACALELVQAGCKVKLVCLCPFEKMKGSARYFADKWTNPTLLLAEAKMSADYVVVDGLFGSGLNRSIPEIAINFFSKMNNPIVAIDLPSGLDGDSGNVIGYAPDCDHTVSFFRIKSGHLLLPGRTLCGVTHICDIGIVDSCLDYIHPKWRCNSKPDFQSLIAHAGDNKFSRGCLAIVASGKMRGATQLVARAAQRTGAGMVYVYAPINAVSHYQQSLASVPVLPSQSPRELLTSLSDKRIHALVVGPGLLEIEDDPGLLRQLVALKKPIVIDAAAINALAQDVDIVASAEADTPVVLTPHAGEFARLFPDIDKTNIAEAVLEGSRRLGCVIVYKGYTTLIASPSGEVVFTINAQPDLATSGTGDVLAGMIGALLSKKWSPEDAATCACWWHAEAGKGFGLIAEDVVKALPTVARYYLKRQ